MRPRRCGDGSRPFDWYMRTVVVAVPAWLASSSMVSWPSSFMRLMVLLQNGYYESIYSHSDRSNRVARTAMQARHLLQRHPIPMICHFDHGLDLRDGELAVGEIAAKFSISGPSVSRYLAILRAAGLVTGRRAANRIYSASVTDRLAVSVGEFIALILRMPGVRR